MERDWPGFYRCTYLYCAEWSEAGLFRGIRSGASYFVLGGIVEEVEFAASARGQSVMMGESLSVVPGRPVEVTVSVAENRPLETIELIGDPGGEVRLVA